MLKIPEEIQRKIHDEFVNKIVSRCDETKYFYHSETIEIDNIKYVVDVELDIDFPKKINFIPSNPTEEKDEKINYTINCYSYRISLLNSDMDDVIDCPLKKELEIDIKEIIN